MAHHLISKYLQSSNSRFQSCLSKTNFKPLSSRIWRRKLQTDRPRLWDLATLLPKCYCQGQIHRHGLERKTLLSLTSSSNYASPKKLAIGIGCWAVWKEIKLFTAAWELTNFLLFAAECSAFLSQVEDAMWGSCRTWSWHKEQRFQVCTYIWVTRAQ